MKAEKKDQPVRKRAIAPVMMLAALLSGCGGSSGGGSTAGTGGGGSPTPSPVAGCSLRERQDWAAAQIREWYLFPDTLPASLSPAGFGTVDDYIDALTATARAQSKDRFFTYLTSIAEENAFFSSGSSAGFGVRLTGDATARRLFIAEAFEGAPALAAGIDRGTEILAIGTSAGTLRTVDNIYATEGSAGITNALGPNTAGTTRVLRILDTAGVRDVTVTKADFTLTPVSSRYGAQVITDAGRQYGYINLRTFISTAETPLRNAFADLRARGITEVIVDVRYNGGGLVSVAELIGDLFGRSRNSSEVQGFTTFRPEKSSNNVTKFFASQAQSIAPTKVAFITTGSSASASELIINAQLPYLAGNVALIGSNTFGKPVGQIALDRSICDDRLRVVAFATENANRQGDYYTGLASKVSASCAAPDDITIPLGDPREASTRAALNFFQGVACTPIASSGITSASAGARRQLLSPQKPSAPQRETPGLF